MVESNSSGSRGRGGGGRGNASNRGGRGRGGRGGSFGGSLSKNQNANSSNLSQEKGKGKAGNKKHDHPYTSTADQASQPSSSIQESGMAMLNSTPALEGETCFICAEPVKLYSVPPCNHKTCHICAIRLRVLYKKHDCTFCKAPSDTLIFTSKTEKDYLSFNAEEIPFKDERLNIYFESEQNRDETLVLLHFNCPDISCEYAGASWQDLKTHVRSEHGKLFCDLCVKNKKIFVHEHSLFSSGELTQHIRDEHKHCEFCKLNFYSDDELYVHMRDRHEQCFICKRNEETRDEYQRDYNALEKHFRQKHFLCESKQCLEQKFVVFESELDFKAHQVAEHGTELSSREKRDALRVTANFHYDPNNVQPRQSGSAGQSSRGRGREENETSNANRDPLGVSVLASRAHVPGTGGPANHQSRRAFGSGLTSSSKIQEDEQASALRAAAEERTRQTQAYFGKIAELVNHSDVKMHSIRTNIKTFQAGEMSAKDLIDSIRSIISDRDSLATTIRGLVDVLEQSDQKQDILDAWTAVQVEQTHFPSLGGGRPQPSSSQGMNANLSTITRGQVRTIKNNSTAANRGVWANVEAAAASGGSVYRNAARSTPSTSRSSHFPSLGPSKTPVVGSAVYAARANARGSSATPWSGSSASSAPRPAPVGFATTSAAPSPSVKPYSIDASKNTQKANQTSIRANSSAFPSLPVNAEAAQLAAQKRQLFANKRSAGNSGAATPGSEAWLRSNVGRIDASGALTPELDTYTLHERLSDAAQIGGNGYGSTTAANGSSGGGKKGKQQKKVLVSMGGVHRG
ncbi:hypothetical protein L7F22_003193 [Adiantum nelumboides]|nr:hypothetical protein [Adiantum nelumboides]